MRKSDSNTYGLAQCYTYSSCYRYTYGSRDGYTNSAVYGYTYTNGKSKLHA